MSNNERFLTDISDQIAAGKTTGAKQTLTKSWRDAVPDLPIRFAVILVDLDKEAVKRLLQRIKKNKTTPRLKLEWKEDSIQVYTSQGKVFRIGNLPASDTTMLLDLGKKAKQYRAKLLEIKQTEAGEIDYLAIELIRPEKKTEPQTENVISVSAAVEAINESIDKEIDLGLDWEE